MFNPSLIVTFTSTISLTIDTENKVVTEIGLNDVHLCVFFFLDVVCVHFFFRFYYLSRLFLSETLIDESFHHCLFFRPFYSVVESFFFFHNFILIFTEDLTCS